MKKMNTLGVMILLCLFGSDLLAQFSIDKGKTLYEAKRYPDAEKLFSAVSYNHKDYAAAQYYLGRIAYDRKLYDDALDYIEEAVDHNQTEGDYFNLLGDTYAAIGSKASIFKQMSVGPKALRAWEKATQLDAKNIPARVSLVGVYTMAPAFMGGGEDKAKAIANEVFPLLEEQLKRTPDHHLYNYWYGKCSAITGLKLDRGDECLQKYIAFTTAADEPSIAGANMRLGQIKEKKGNKAEANKYYGISLRQDASSKLAKEGFERTK
jgi:tetratricopeptide (TPR) repeat protein